MTRRSRRSTPSPGGFLSATELTERGGSLVQDRDPFRGTRSRKASGERVTQYGTTTKRPPNDSAPQISQTEKSKANE